MAIKNLRRVGLVLLIVIISSIISIIGAELVLKIIKGPQLEYTFWQSQNQYTLDTDLIYILKPNYTQVTQYDEFDEHLSTNELGMRGKNQTEQPSDEVIIAVGDSFTYGFKAVFQGSNVCASLLDIPKGFELRNR